MSLIKIWTFPFFLFFDQMGSEIMVDDRLDKEQAHLDKKYWFYSSLSYWDFLKELTHDFGQKLDISSLFFQQNTPRVMSHDYLVRKRALLDYKKWILHSCHNGLFIGVNP